MGREGRTRTQGGRHELGADPATTGGQRGMTTTDTTAAAREALLVAVHSPLTGRTDRVSVAADALIAAVRAEQPEAALVATQNAYRNGKIDGRADSAKTLAA